MILKASGHTQISTFLTTMLVSFAKMGGFVFSIAQWPNIATCPTCIISIMLGT